MFDEHCIVIFRSYTVHRRVLRHTRQSAAALPVLQSHVAAHRGRATIRYHGSTCCAQREAGKGGYPARRFARPQHELRHHEPTNKAT